MSSPTLEGRPVIVEWEISKADYGSSLLDRLLAEDWEPFSAVAGSRDVGYGVFLRRPKGVVNG